MNRWVSVVAAVMAGVGMAAAAMGQPGGAAWRDAKPEEVSPPAPMREFRGAWVATVANIDWPTSRTASVSQQRAEMLAMLDAMKAANFNAVVFQVRPSCDAFYKSELEPWSEFLTGESGKAPAEEFDPLAEWIREAHARGMELHAWVNPFRARHFDAKKPDAATHVSRTKPELVKAYDRFLWLDPGEAEAQEHTFRVIADITSRYDIDGLHIDDYFYPYPKGSEPFPDGPSWTRYSDDGGRLSRDDWRRDNINRFVKRLYETTKATKKHVKVGISPFGIWRPEHPAGVKGMDAYEKLYADARLWLREGWLDYCSPQLYWRVEAPQQPFVPLLKWWEGENVKARSMWPGLYPSRLLPGEIEKNAGWTGEEIVKQVGLIREFVKLGPGSVHFSAKAIVSDAGGVRTGLARGPFAAPALVPATPWLDDVPPAAPLLSVEADAKGGIAVRWTMASATDEASRVWAVAVRAGQQWTTIIAPGAERNFTATGTGIDAVAIWAVDRAGNLSVPAVMVR
ncbi:MAG: family 10 glycosylhydrolase [Tepidisphaera sp.]